MVKDAILATAAVFRRKAKKEGSPKGADPVLFTLLPS